MYLKKAWRVDFPSLRVTIHGSVRPAAEACGRATIRAVARKRSIWICSAVACGGSGGARDPIVQANRNETQHVQVGLIIAPPFP